MQTFVNLLTLRPSFTFVGLQIVWYIYLTHTVVQTYIAVVGSLVCIDPKRDKLGSLVAKLYSANSRNSRATRSCPTAS